MNSPSLNLDPNHSKQSLCYALERPGAWFEFLDRSALLEFLRECMPSFYLKLSEDATTNELATFAARRGWTLLEFESGENVRVPELLFSAMNIIHNLLSTTELNMDDLEPTTLTAIQEASTFENEAATHDFRQNCDTPISLTASPTKDICYGPIAPGQFFIDRLNPLTPQIYKATGIFTDHVLVCENWGMAERAGTWSFVKYEHGGGIQISKLRLARMQRVSALDARHFSEQELRHRDDDWRARYDPDRPPVQIVRCTCGAGDSAPTGSHTLGCFCRGEIA